MVQLARPRPGHFDLGTGYHGDLWLDLDALLLRPSLLRAPVRWLAARLREHSVDAVCGPLEGGAFLGYAVADLLGVAFLAGYRRPGETARYNLTAVPGGIAGWRVGVVDDAVNAGTAVVACLEELRGRGAVPVAVAALVSLGEASTTVQARMRVPFYPASTVPSRAWPAERCPLCAEGTPYTDPLSGDVVTPLPGRGMVRAGTPGFRGGRRKASSIWWTEAGTGSLSGPESRRWPGGPAARSVRRR
jgi:orotate phosphoribosyltransferase